MSWRAEPRSAEDQQPSAALGPLLRCGSRRRSSHLSWALPPSSAAGKDTACDYITWTRMPATQVFQTWQATSTKKRIEHFDELCKHGIFLKVNDRKAGTRRAYSYIPYIRTKKTLDEVCLVVEGVIQATLRVGVHSLFAAT